MAKRFTDTGKWNKPFIRSMKAPYKLLWLYILDECDHAGVWQVDLDVAQIKIGEKLNLETALSSFSEKVYPFDGGGKWFIPDFIEFQYGELNPDNRAHKSVLNILSKYNLLNIQIKPLASPLHGAMDMDKDKDKDKESEKSSIISSKNFTAPSQTQVAEYITKYSSEKKITSDPDAFAQKFVLHYQQKGWMVGKVKMKDWQAGVRNWITNGWFGDVGTSNGKTPNKLVFN